MGKSIRNKNCWEKSVVKNNMVFQQSVVVLAFITLSFGAETCYDGPGGASPTEGRAGGHNIQVTKAMISKPAPPFSGTAVLNGEFTELKLSDYLGKYLVFFFYPLDFTFVCPTEILAFNDRVAATHHLATRLKYLDPVYTTSAGEMADIPDPVWLAKLDEAVRSLQAAPTTEYTMA